MARLSSTMLGGDQQDDDDDEKRYRTIEIIIGSIVGLIPAFIPVLALVWVLFDFTRNAEPPIWWDYIILVALIIANGMLSTSLFRMGWIEIKELWSRRIK